MGRIPDAFIDDVLARTDIVELIGARVPLKRQGREYSARCPFHDERSPSFTVSPTKQFYHCFGCGAHGTALKFVMEYDRLEFLDALEELAKRVGLEIPRETRQRNESGESRDLYGTLDAASKFFQRQLETSTKAQTYLDRRAVDTENRARFSIGYAPEGWEALKNALGGDERRLRLLDQAGLLSKNDAGRVYDKFRDRVMFPIHDRRGRVIAFGGRSIPSDPPDREDQKAGVHARTSPRADDGPKYLNSPETALFHKGRELYGLWQVRQAHARIPRLVVVEGYMDVVALFQYGVTTAVATLGTATTPDHAELLFRNAADVYFCFDGDRAGRGAAWKALESVLPRMRDGRQAFFLFLPEGEDPDTLVRTEGADGFDVRLRAAVPLSEFFYAEQSKEINLATLDGRARLAERTRPMLSVIPDGAFRDLMFARLTELTGVGAATATSAAPTQTPRPRTVATPQKRSLVRTSIALLLQQPALAQALEPPYVFSALLLPGVPLLMELLQLCRARPDISAGVLLEHFAEREEAAALHKLVLQDLLIPAEQFEQEFTGAIAGLNRATLKQREDELLARGLAALSADERRELVDLQRELRAATSSADS